MGYQYTQGSLVTITITTTDQSGAVTPPDGMISPILNIDLVSPITTFTVVASAFMTPITSSWWYFNLDSTGIPLGSYIAVAGWTVGGFEVTQEVRFDIVGGDGFTLLPVDPISRLRLRLKDNDPNPIKWVWNDQELSEYLNGSLDEFNSAPPRSSFIWMNIPSVYITNILKGAQISALEAEATRVAQQPITYNDKGITVNLPQQASTLQNIARELREQQEKERLRIKRQMYPKSGFIVGQNTPYMSYPPLRASDRRWY